MTAQELIAYLCDKFSIREWPKTLEVDAETYANACQLVFDRKFKDKDLFWDVNEFPPTDIVPVSVSLGQHAGIMFKNIELILKRASDVSKIEQAGNTAVV